MAFKSFRVAIANTDTDVIECPATQEGAAVLQIGNRSSGAVTCDIKLYKQALGTALALVEGFSIAANDLEKIPAPLSLEAGDKIVMVASAADALTASGTFTFSAATPAAVGFTPLGEWSDVATYAINDVVSLSGTSYISLQNGSTNQDPETETAYWMVLSERGPMGIGDMTGANNLSEITNSATARANLGLDSSSTPEFAGVNLGHATDTALTRSAAGKLDVAGHTVLTDDESGQGPITGGAAITPKDLGTKSSGTVTVAVSDCQMQTYTNGGAHSLDVSGTGATIVVITNNSSAGTLTTSAFNVVSGDPFTTTNGHVFRCTMENWGSGKKWLFVERVV